MWCAKSVDIFLFLLVYSTPECIIPLLEPTAFVAQLVRGKMPRLQLAA